MWEKIESVYSTFKEQRRKRKNPNPMVTCGKIEDWLPSTKLKFKHILTNVKFWGCFYLDL